MVKAECTIVLPEGFQAEKKEGKLFIKKGGKELSRLLPLRKLKVEVSGNEIRLKVETMNDRALIGTYKSHFNNMIAGLNEPFEYKLKMCSTHFPISAKPKDGDIIVQNFLGGKNPIRVKIPKGVDVSVNGDVITVKSADVELAGRAASNLERSTFLNNKDRRVFNDGIFIIKKPE